MGLTKKSCNRDKFVIQNPYSPIQKGVPKNNKKINAGDNNDTYQSDSTER